MLHAPAMLDQIAGQPIEQFRMRWPIPLLAEIVRSAHQSLPEVPTPNAVHQHAGGQRILRRGEKFRQGGTSSVRRHAARIAWRIVLRLLAPQHRGNHWPDAFARAADFASMQDMDVERLVAVKQDEGPLLVAAQLAYPVVDALLRYRYFRQNALPRLDPPVSDALPIGSYTGDESSSRSITFGQASGELSFKKASISSGFGGSPIRSKVARRIKVRLSASAAGARPATRIAASRNRSIEASDHPSGSMGGLIALIC